MTAQWLHTIGLALGMAGVVIIFIWGPAQPYLDMQGRSLLVMTSQDDEATKLLRGQYVIMSRVGLGLIGVGFAVQLVAVWI